MDFFNFGHTSLRGCNVLFVVLESLPTQMADHRPTISFIMPDLWPHFVSGTELENSLVDFIFFILHTHPLDGVDVRFGIYKI